MKWMAALFVCLCCRVASPDTTVPDTAGVHCRSVRDCWLDGDGHPIARPKRYRGKPLPRGDCGAHLNWLRNHLSCEEQRCVVRHVGDRC